MCCAAAPSLRSLLSAVGYLSLMRSWLEVGSLWLFSFLSLNPFSIFSRLSPTFFTILLWPSPSTLHWASVLFVRMGEVAECLPETTKIGSGNGCESSSPSIKSSSAYFLSVSWVRRSLKFKLARMLCSIVNWVAEVVNCTELKSQVYFSSKADSTESLFSLSPSVNQKNLSISIASLQRVIKPS